MWYSRHSGTLSEGNWALQVRMGKTLRMVSMVVCMARTLLYGPR